MVRRGLRELGGTAAEEAGSERVRRPGGGRKKLTETDPTLLADLQSLAENQRLGRPAMGVGANSVIEQAIIDKNARIGRNVRIVNQTGAENAEETSTHVIRDGVVVTHKSIILPDGAVI